MAGRTDDDDTQEQQIAPRYPDAAPAPGDEAWRRPAVPTPPPGAAGGEPSAGAPRTEGEPGRPEEPGAADRTVVWQPPAGPGQQPGESPWAAGSGSAWPPQNPPASSPAAQSPSAQGWPPPEDPNRGYGASPQPPGQSWSPPQGPAWTPPPSAYGGQYGSQQPYGGQQQYGGQYPGPGGYWGGQQEWGAPPASGVGEYGTSALVVIGAIVLLIFGVLFLLFGAFAIAAGGLIEQALLEVGPVPELEGISARAIRDIVLVLGVIVLVIGLLKMISGIGIFLHKQWARVIGILLAGLFTLLGVLSIVASLDARTAGGSDLTFAVVITVAYAGALFALIAGGDHFRRRYQR